MRYFLCLLILFITSCSKKETSQVKDSSVSFTIDGQYNGTLSYAIGMKPIIVLNFTEAITSESLEKNIILKSDNGDLIQMGFDTSNEGKTVQLNLQTDLKSFTIYILSVSGSLKTKNGGRIVNPLTIILYTGIDNTDKFSRISDEELLTLVQKQTFKYFWDFGHPVSGLARERNTSGNLVTSGGSGFGIMSIIVAIERGFITKEEGFVRIRKLFLF